MVACYYQSSFTNFIFTLQTNAGSANHRNIHYDQCCTAWKLVEPKSRHEAGSGWKGNLLIINEVSADKGWSLVDLSLGLRGGG